MNTIDEKSAFIKSVPEADRMLKMLSDFGGVLLQVEQQISPDAIRRQNITDIDTKELIKFNNELDRRNQIGLLSHFGASAESRKQATHLFKWPSEGKPEQSDTVPSTVATAATEEPLPKINYTVRMRRDG